MSLPGTGGSLPQHSDILTATPTGPEDIKNLIAELKRRGNAAFKAQSFLEAETLYAKAIEHDPKGEAALYGNRSAARLGMKRYAEALTDADEAIKMGWTKGHYRRGQALSGLSRWREAQKAFEKCAELDAANKEALKEAEKAKAKADDAEKKEMDVVVEDVTKKVDPAAAKKSNGDTPKNKSSSVKAKKSEKSAADDDGEDLDPSKMRGYKTLEDGRKTTFFHMEIDPEQKAKLAAENKPKALSGPAPIAAVAAAGKDGSAWNAAGTFEEKDMTKWAQDKIKQLVKGASTVFEGPGGDSGIVEATNVTDFDGVASVSFIRGSKRYPFDFTFSVDWTASISEGEVTGKLFFSQFSSDDDDFDAEIKWENRDKAGASARPLMDHLKKDFRESVEDKLRDFIAEFRKL